VGSTFTFTVPLARAADSSMARVVAPNLSRVAILIVAASRFEVPLAAQRLEHWGADICAVSDLEAALAQLAERRFDVMLVDGALGATVSEALARAGCALVARRIVLITPEQRGELPALQAAGFSDYLVKPIRAASLGQRFVVQQDLAPGTPALVPQDLECAVAGGAPSLAILIAEDNEINALLARSLIAKLGHRPAVVQNGVEAIASWRDARQAGTPFDLVLMDVQMPEMDGIEAARRMRHEEAEGLLARTPIIALTANAFAEDREACLAAGMDDILMKPLDRDRLTQALAAARPSPVAA
jgi:CheY-like chemotaxis protein